MRVFFYLNLINLSDISPQLWSTAILRRPSPFKNERFWILTARQSWAALVSESHLRRIWLKILAFVFRFFRIPAKWQIPLSIQNLIQRQNFYSQFRSPGLSHQVRELGSWRQRTLGFSNSFNVQGRWHVWKFGVEILMKEIRWNRFCILIWHKKSDVDFSNLQAW